MKEGGTVPLSYTTRNKKAIEDVRAIQDLLWNEALFALQRVDSFSDDNALTEFLRQSLPQNSQETRKRYVVSLMRWFFPDGVRGLAAHVWLRYRDDVVAKEILRYL